MLWRYLLSRHGEQIAEFVEVESAEHNDRPPLGPVMTLAKKRKATLPRSKIGSFIATLTDSKGVDLSPFPHGGR